MTAPSFKVPCAPSFEVPGDKIQKPNFHVYRLQPLNQAVPPLPPREMGHPLPGGGRHPQQEAGDLQQLPGQAHPQPQGREG